MDGKHIFSYRLGRRSAQKVLDAAQLRTGQLLQLPRLGYEVTVRAVGHDYIRLANNAGHYVLRCATLSSKHWPQDLFPKGVRLRESDWHGNEISNS